MTSERFNRKSKMLNEVKHVNTARLLATEVLISVETKNQYANLVLPKKLREKQTSDRHFMRRDAAFTSELVYGTLRHQGTIDWVLSKHSAKPIKELDSQVRACLRLGVYQLHYLRVADHAAISETVSVSRELAGEGSAKFVNAVLRSIQRESKETIREKIENIPDLFEKLGVKHSHPKWIVSQLAKSLDAHHMGIGELDAALAANNVPPMVTLVARPSLITVEELVDEANCVLETTSHLGHLSPHAVTLQFGDPGVLPSIRDGKAGVQDQGSQFAALLLANAPLLSPAKNASQRWLDLCAGPGGKAALLGAIGQKVGAQLTANEISRHRARLLRRSVQALNNVQITVEDGRQLRDLDGFTRVLVDAPCLGLGSLRRRPEARWRKQPEDLDQLLPLQQELLQNAIKLTQPGGVIAWVTCSMHVKETLGQVRDALTLGSVELLGLDANKMTKNLVPNNVSEETGATTDKNAHIQKQTLQLWPHIHGTDAIFVALLRKTGSHTSTGK